ncbi:MAG: class I SAM-dependent methyltransferase [Chloroflexota bacterium]
MNELGADVKTCCASLYASDWARLLLGETFHPGGLALTERLGELLRLGPDDQVLDVASGLGTSAIFLAERFGCAVVGIDYGEDEVRMATERAKQATLADRVRFERGDAERLPLPDARVDAVICECAFCSFPDKAAAAREFARVLRPGGRVGLADLTRRGPIPPDLETLLGWLACLGDARPVAEYVAFLRDAGFSEILVEAHPDALRSLARDVRGKLLGAEVLAKLGKLPLPGADFQQARQLARAASAAVEEGRFGYSLLVAWRD